MSELSRLPVALPPEVPVTYGPAPVVQMETGPEPAGIPFSHYVWIVRRHLWVILAFIVSCVLLAFIVSMRMKPIYESTAAIDVDRQAPAEILGQESTRGDAPSDSDQFLATQIRLIQSDAVLRPVAERLGLLKEEKQLVESDPERAMRVTNAPIRLNQLSVTRPPNTYLLLISYRSSNPQLAADVANAVANSYLEHIYELRTRSSGRLSVFMEKQLDELKAKMEKSSMALASFERELNVINPEEKTNILSARLLQLNQDYTTAEDDRVRKEAAYNSMKSGTLEAAQISTQGEGLAKLTEKINEAEQHFAQVKTVYGPNHPEYRKAASELAELQKQFNGMRRNVADRIEVEYRQALNREQMLKADVLQTKAEYDQLNARSFEYQSLKREADADKTLYEELVKKIKEASINSGFQANNIRIADMARPALRPVSPRVFLNTVVAFFFSTLLAIGGAILVDVMDTTIRDAEQTSRYLGVDVIGVLPSVRKTPDLAVLNSPQEAAAALTIDPVKHQNGYDRKKYYRTISSFEEAIRTLRNTILLGDIEGRMRAVLMTSASPSEGKTTAAVFLAVAHAEQGRKTLVVDGDLRRPSVHRKFGLSPERGFSNVLTNEATWDEVLIPIKGNPNLYIMPAGPPTHRAADLISQRISEILDECCKGFDLVIIDGPPLLGFAESLQMATAADGVLIIGRAGVTQRKHVRSVLQALHRIRANVLGVVLNQVKSDSSDGYSYGYYRSYYSA